MQLRASRSSSRDNPSNIFNTFSLEGIFCSYCYNSRYSIHYFHYYYSDYYKLKSKKQLNYITYINHNYIYKILSKNVFCRELNRLNAHGMPNSGNPFLFPLRIPGDNYSTVNLVPVDYAARLIAAISRKAEGINKTFHIVNPSPPTLGELAV